MKEKMIGRPSKVTLEDKKMILHRFCINCGAASINSVSSHGRFKRLAEFAHTIGYESLQDYDFANDKSFRNYLDDYLAREKQRKASHCGYVGSVYTPLNLSHFFGLSKQEQYDVLQQREKYYTDLYESAAQALETYDDMNKKYSAMMIEQSELMQRIEKQTEELADLKQLNSTYKQAIQELTKDKAYYRKRVAQNIQDQAAPKGKNDAHVITANTSLSSLLSADQEMRASKDGTDAEIEDLLKNIDEIRKRRAKK